MGPNALWPIQPKFWVCHGGWPRCSAPMPHPLDKSWPRACTRRSWRANTLSSAVFKVDISFIWSVLHRLFLHRNRLLLGVTTARLSRWTAEQSAKCWRDDGVDRWIDADVEVRQTVGDRHQYANAANWGLNDTSLKYHQPLTAHRSVEIVTSLKYLTASTTIN